MERAVVEGIALEYEVAGIGEPVILIHGALIADAFRPLLAEPNIVSVWQVARDRAMRRLTVCGGHRPRATIAVPARRSALTPPGGYAVPGGRANATGTVARSSASTVQPPRSQSYQARGAVARPRQQPP